MDTQFLDNPVWGALTGPQQDWADQLGGAARYRPEVSPFGALADPGDPQGWHDLATLVGPAGSVVIVGADTVVPPEWTEVARIEGVLMNGAALTVAPDPAARPLGPDDVAEMLDLVARTQPGPFATETISLGGYLGLHDHGRLVAMAGQRFRPESWCEISAVCTDPDFRGQGLANRLIRAVGAGIHERGELPFLHAASTNVNAIALYERMGFVVHRHTAFVILQAPGQPLA
jgi:ribosomal protein S18 acetylase RimI-like enzyme